MATTFKITVTGKGSDGRTVNATILNNIPLPTDMTIEQIPTSAIFAGVIKAFQPLVTYKITEASVATEAKVDSETISGILTGITPGTDTWDTDDQLKFINYTSPGLEKKQTTAYRHCSAPIADSKFLAFATACEAFNVVPVEAYLYSTSDTAVWKATS